jgi:hypothetical protein
MPHTILLVSTHRQITPNPPLLPLHLPYRQRRTRNWNSHKSEYQTRLQSKHCSWFGRPTRKAGALGDQNYLSSIAAATSRQLRQCLEASSTDIAPSLHFNHVHCCCCNLRTLMPYSTPPPRAAGRIFANRRLRPTIDEEALEPANGVAGHDHADLPPRSKLSTSMIGLMATRADPTITQSDTFPSLSDTISSSDDPARQASNHRRYEIGCSH